MPEIDLEAHEFASRDPRTGKWRRPISKRAARNWFLLSLVPIGYIGWNAASLQPMTLFEGTMVFTAFSAIFLSAWLRDVY